MIYPAQQSDTDTDAELIYKMVVELESIGEIKAVNKSDAIQTLTLSVAEEIADNNYQILLAESTCDKAAVGCAIGQIINLGPHWQIQRVLHIDVVYVEPEN